MDPIYISNPKLREVFQTNANTSFCTELIRFRKVEYRGASGMKLGATAYGVEAVSDLQREPPLEFPIFKLTPELRSRIYYFALVFAEPINPAHSTRITTFDMHKQKCVFRQHEHVRRVKSRSGTQTTNFLLCKIDHRKHLARLDIHQVIKHPESALSLLLTCKEIFKEAMPLFYRYNTFQFNNLNLVNDFFEEAPRSRRQYLTSLALGNFHYDCPSDVRFMLQLKYSDLQTLELVAFEEGNSGTGFHGFNKSFPAFQETWGMRVLMIYLRGLKEFQVEGYDFRYSDGKWNKIDVNDSQGSAEYIRKRVMAPKQTHKN